MDTEGSSSAVAELKEKTKAVLAKLERLSLEKGELGFRSFKDRYQVLIRIFLLTLHTLSIYLYHTLYPKSIHCLTWSEIEIK